MDTKQEALAVFLNCEATDLEQANYDTNLFEYGVESYLVLGEQEVNEYIKERILNDLWAFNAEFILSHSRIEVDEHNEAKILKALKMVQEKLCEDATPLIRALLENEEEFIEDAIDADGRGHFLSGYDSKEDEIVFAEELFYIYRQN